MELTEKQFDEIMSKMFKAVGQTYRGIKVSCKDPEWYTKREWTEKQENEFRDWMIKYLIRKTKLPMKLIQWEVAVFLLDHGWKYKQEREKSK